MIKKRFKIWFLTIITFGLIRLKWKNIQNKQKNLVFQNDKLPFEFQELLNCFSNTEITKAERTLTKITVFLKQAKQVDLQALKNLKGINGLFVKSDSVSLITGEYTQAIYEQLIEFIETK
ncbi:hypothetical protein [Mycoplasma nasistruthionis]|uniref:PTS glucose transporter subunit IIB n=1 Tax=Mycoplasma nasistruthionis TaxID=353852 RepID=A0A4Y6I6M5_9MOLU|nr:hypothetical protein [Mycoplasma nasistruthionis]QDF64897.1 hypothetical protein FIV53_01040 [Mycoplasma nasistruthionis]